MSSVLLCGCYKAAFMVQDEKNIYVDGKSAMSPT